MFELPVVAEIVRQRLVSIVDEAETVMVRMAYSSTIAEAQDFTVAIFDAQRRLVGQSRRALGAFVGTAGHGMRKMLDAIPPESLRPGDVLLTNDPWLGGGHKPDMLAVSPLFSGDRIVGYAVTSAHVADIGGNPTAEAADVFEEGLHIPPMFLYRQGELNEDLMTIVLANSRLPKQVYGDFQAVNAANATVARRVGQLLADYGLPDLTEVSDFLQERAAAMVRQRVARLTNGTYRAELLVDGVDDAITLVATVRVEDESIHVDFDGTDPQVPWGWNVPFQLTCAEAAYDLFLLLAPEVHLLQGSFEPFTFSAPSGCILHPRFPAACMVRTNVLHNVASLMFRVMSQVPGSRTVANFGGLWTFRFRGSYRDVPSVYQRGGPPQVQPTYTETYFFSGGTGALDDRDGETALPTPANCANVPVEVMEARTPVLFHRKRFVADSGGAGRYHGGVGQEVVVEVLADEPIDFIPGSHGRLTNPPFGVHGGLPGSGGALTVDGEPAHRQRAQRVRRGQLVRVAIPGGGGLGPPAERDGEAARREHHDG